MVKGEKIVYFAKLWRAFQVDQINTGQFQLLKLIYPLLVLKKGYK